MDAHERLVRFLSSVAPMPPGYDAQVRERFQARVCDAGQPLVRAGERADGLGYVVSGLFRFYYVDPEGRERIKSFAAEDDFVVSYESLLTGEPSAYAIEALERSELLFIGRDAYLEGVERDAYWSTIARKYVERIFTEKVGRERSLLMDDAATRYERFVRDHRNLHERVRLKDVASYLGMTDVSLSRVRRARARAAPRRT